jgi:nitrate reductase delta subunit
MMSPWAGSGPSRSRLGSARPGASRVEAAERVKDWTREQFGLGEEDTIVLQESASTLPGYPPLETLVAFWSGGERHHFKVFKPVEEVAMEDLPPGWMRPALAGDIACECC